MRLNSKHTLGLSPVPTQGQMCMPCLLRYNAPAVRSHNAAQCNARETKLWSYFWNTSYQTGRWLCESRPCVTQEPQSRLDFRHRKMEESITILNLMWLMFNFPNPPQKTQSLFFYRIKNNRNSRLACTLIQLLQWSCFISSAPRMEIHAVEGGERRLLCNSLVITVLAFTIKVWI